VHAQDYHTALTFLEGGLDETGRNTNDFYVIDLCTKPRTYASTRKCLYMWTCSQSISAPPVLSGSPVRQLAAGALQHDGHRLGTSDLVHWRSQRNTISFDSLMHLFSGTGGYTPGTGRGWFGSQRSVLTAIKQPAGVGLWRAAKFHDTVCAYDTGTPRLLTSVCMAVIVTMYLYLTEENKWVWPTIFTKIPARAEHTATAFTRGRCVRFFFFFCDYDIELLLVVLATQ
jgi:hypothetical protein